VHKKPGSFDKSAVQQMAVKQTVYQQ